MFDFVSAAPRPKIAPSRSVGSNGGESHSDSSPGGHDVVVAVEQHGRRALGGAGISPTTTGAVSGSSSEPTSSTPASRSSSTIAVVRPSSSASRLLGVVGRRDGRDRDEPREILP